MGGFFQKMQTLNVKALKMKEINEITQVSEKDDNSDIPQTTKDKRNEDSQE
jgi:hypothetical protein